MAKTEHGQDCGQSGHNEQGGKGQKYAPNETRRIGCDHQHELSMADPQRSTEVIPPSAKAKPLRSLLLSTYLTGFLVAPSSVVGGGLGAGAQQRRHRHLLLTSGRHLDFHSAGGLGSYFPT